MSRLSIPKELLKSGLLRTFLHGTRSVLQRELGLKSLPYSLDDKVKAQQANQNNDVFPYGYIAPSDMQVNKEAQGNPRAMQRTGWRVGVFGASRNISNVGFIVPMRVGLELHYFHNDADFLLRVGEMFVMLSSMNNLNFDVKFGSNTDSPFILNTRIEIPDNMSIPIADTGDTTKPGGGELSIPLVLHTYAGFFKKMSSLYYADPIIGIATEKADDTVVFDENFPGLMPEEYRTNDLK